jgi:hypothetical protein
MQSIRELLHSSSENDYGEYQKMRIAWGELSSTEKMEMISELLHEIIKKLVSENELAQNGIALSKLLSLQITLEEAINCEITNYLCYIK